MLYWLVIYFAISSPPPLPLFHSLSKYIFPSVAKSVHEFSFLSLSVAIIIDFCTTTPSPSSSHSKFSFSYFIYALSNTPLSSFLAEDIHVNNDILTISILLSVAQWVKWRKLMIDTHPNWLKRKLWQIFHHLLMIWRNI